MEPWFEVWYCGSVGLISKSVADLDTDLLLWFYGELYEGIHSITSLEEIPERELLLWARTRVADVLTLRGI